MAPLETPVGGSVPCPDCDTTISFLHHDSKGIKEAGLQLLKVHRDRACPKRRS